MNESPDFRREDQAGAINDEITKKIQKGSMDRELHIKRLEREGIRKETMKQ